VDLIGLLGAYLEAQRQPRGLLDPGGATLAQLSRSDIDLSRPKIANDDGSFSTERTITVEAGGKHYLIPSIVGGKQRTPQEAIALWQAGQNKPVGVYNSDAEAERAAVERSARIGRIRGNE